MSPRPSAASASLSKTHVAAACVGLLMSIQAASSLLFQGEAGTI
jgi:hypothetical protein